MKNRMQKVLSVVILLGIWTIMTFYSPVFAADHSNLEEGLPTEIEDAYPTSYLNREMQGVFRYERTEGGEDRFVFQPRFEYGFARNWQLSVSSLLLAGDADRTGSGDIHLGVLYNFNTEAVYIPAFAAALEADLPSGKDSAGIDTTVKLIASKMPFPRSYLLHRMHLNVLWTHNSGRREDERRDIYKAIAGFSVRAGKDTMLVADIIREQEMEKGKDSTIAEIGIRRQISPLSVLSLGAGAGIGEDSPDMRFVIGFQKSF